MPISRQFNDGYNMDRVIRQIFAHSVTTAYNRPVNRIRAGVGWEDHISSTIFIRFSMVMASHGEVPGRHMNQRCATEGRVPRGRETAKYDILHEQLWARLLSKPKNS